MKRKRNKSNNKRNWKNYLIPIVLSILFLGIAGVFASSYISNEYGSLNLNGQDRFTIQNYSKITGTNISGNYITTIKTAYNNNSISPWEQQGRIVVGHYINITNYKDNSTSSNPDPSHTFVNALKIDLTNLAEGIKPTGLQINWRSNSTWSGADGAGVTVDMGLLDNSNSTMKGFQALLQDFGNKADDMRAGYFRIEKNNNDSLANAVLITSEGTGKVDNGIYLTGGGGFTKGIYMDANGDFDTGIQLNRKSTAGGNGIYTSGSWGYEIYLNRSAAESKIAGDTILGMYALRETSGDAFRIYTTNSTGSPVVREAISGGVDLATKTFYQNLDMNDYNISGAGNINMENKLINNIGAAGTDFTSTGALNIVVDDPSAYVLDIRNTNVTNSRGLQIKNASGTAIMTTGNTVITFTPQTLRLSGGKSLFRIDANSSSMTCNSGNEGGMYYDGGEQRMKVCNITTFIPAAGLPKWTEIQNFPVACPAGSYVTQVDGSITCTAVSSIPNAVNITLTNGTFTVTNLTGTGNDYVCVDASGTLYRSDLACA